ncbi:MAG: GntR family transcriptional regulator [Thermodesulfobacteriota bacterium]
MNKEIYKSIKQKILFLEYQPGQILNENVLAREFGVSRTPMREVLYRLEWEQLVRILPRTGTMVTEIEFQKMMHAYQTRGGIESLVGRMAAEQIGGTYLERITTVADHCRELIGHKDLKALAGIDFRFRGILYEAAGNPVLKDVSELLYQITFRIWYLTMDRGDWKAEVGSMENEIRETLHSLRKGGPQATGDIRQNHLLSHIERIQAKFFASRAGQAG